MRCARCRRDTPSVQQREEFCPAFLCDACCEYEKTRQVFKLNPRSRKRRIYAFWFLKCETRPDQFQLARPLVRKCQKQLLLATQKCSLSSLRAFLRTSMDSII